ncbi:MAG: T9SS type A sorting domain-containing protein, partial [Bacteroidota bacterium]
MKKFWKIGLAVLFLSGLAGKGFSQTISTHFFGQNAWMPDTIGSASNCVDPPCLLNGKLHQHWQNVKNSGAQIVRFGGITPDKNKPTNYQYIKMIDSIRANGMEPVMQVPFHKYRYSAQEAANIVQYVNITKGRNVKYWVIGNEPDLGYAYTTAAQIAAYIRPFSSAMKNVDPTIKIIGPECAWFNQGIITGLTTPNGPDDITGRDQSGKLYIDVISFHTYPFNGSQTRSQVISKLTSAGGFKDNLAYLNQRVTACNTAHNRTGAAALRTAVTEANINWQNSGADNLYGLGVNSFIGGQFIAEMFGIGMKSGVDFMNIWSVVEGNSVASSIGYIDPGTGNKKPAYHHFKMLADNFKGSYADGTDNQPNVKAFGSKDAQQICVMIMNQDLAANLNYTVRLNTGAVSGSNALKININAGVGAEYSGTIQNQSTTLLVFNAAGVIIRKCEYSLIGNAVNNQPPTCTDYITTGTNEPGTSTVPAASAVFEFKNIFPNPTAGKFTVQISRGPSEEEDFQVQIFNLIGQEVYNKKLTFLDGQEEIELSPAIASGTYILRVKEGSKDNYLVKK